MYKISFYIAYYYYFITVLIESANKTGTVASMYETRGRHLPETVHINAMEDTFKTLNWEGRGININGEYIYHFRFANDIVITETLQDLELDDE
jgi:hypothetical protein